MIDKNKNSIERDIVKNSYFMIDYNDSNMNILKLQLHMYLMETFYKHKTGEDTLFGIEWYSWDFGPISMELMRTFKEFGNREIVLGTKEKMIANSLPIINRKFITATTQILGQLTNADIVNLACDKGSLDKVVTEYYGKETK